MSKCFFISILGGSKVCVETLGKIWHELQGATIPIFNNQGRYLVKLATCFVTSTLTLLINTFVFDSIRQCLGISSATIGS